MIGSFRRTRTTSSPEIWYGPIDGAFVVEWYGVRAFGAGDEQDYRQGGRRPRKSRARNVCGTGLRIKQEAFMRKVTIVASAVMLMGVASQGCGEPPEDGIETFRSALGPFGSWITMGAASFDDAPAL